MLYKRKLVATLLLPLALAACGGSDDDEREPVAPSTPETPAPPPAPVLDPVTKASQETAARLGLKPLAGNTDTQLVYQVVADIGDSWLFSFDTAGNTFDLGVLYSPFPNMQPKQGPFGVVNRGPYSTFSSVDDTFNLQLDHRTNTLSGIVFFNDKSSTVSGSNWGMPEDLAYLAGTYTFMASAQHFQQEPDDEEELQPGPGDAFPHRLMVGSLRIGEDKRGVLCEQGLANADNKCVSPLDGSTSEGISIRVGYGHDGRTVAYSQRHMPQSMSGDTVWTEFTMGLLHIQAGDRGQVLTIDLNPENGLFDDGYGLYSGVLYAGPQIRLTGNEMDGKWTCSMRGETLGSLEAAGSTSHTDSLGTTYTSTLHYNQFETERADTAQSFNGFVSSLEYGPNGQSGRSTLYAPLSSSLIVAEGDGGRGAALCNLDAGGGAVAAR